MSWGYIFNAAQKKITFTGEDYPTQLSLYNIRNTTANVVIYITDQPGIEGTFSGPSILNLDYDTTAMNDLDVLLFNDIPFEPQNPINVTVVGEVEIKNDAGNPIPVTGTITTTPSGTQDVNIISSIELEIKNDVANPIPVNAVNLDIRDLVFVTDKVDVSGSIVALDAPTLAALELIGVKGADGATIVANANPIPISDAGGSITVDGTLAVTNANLDSPLSGIKTDTALIAASASVLDDWDESDRAKVNPIVGQAGIAANAGAASANTTRVVIVTDQTAIPVSGSITIINSSTTRFANFGANATLNVKASAGKVFSASCKNSNILAVRYLQLHDTATVPAAAAVPLYSFMVGTNTQIIIGTDFFTNAGVDFSTGIAFAFSTTQNTYTAGAAADQATIIQYI